MGLEARGSVMKKRKPKAWTKRELALRPGPVQLALAVIEQWKRDGCPAKDAEAIKYWESIVNTYSKK